MSLPADAGTRPVVPKAGRARGPALIILLAALASVGPFSTDMYLPSLPAVADVFGLTPAGAQWTLSIYLWGFACGQPFHGPLADRFGRRKVIMGALTVFGIASLACTMAPNFESLLLARFCQGLAGGAPMIIVRATVRDTHSADNAAGALSIVASVMAIGPMLAPSIGALIDIAFGWRGVFAGLLVFAMGLWTISYLFLPETLRAEHRQAFAVKPVLAGYRLLMTHKKFLTYGLTSTGSFAGLFIFVSASPILLQEVVGVSETAFGLYFALGALGYAVGSLTGGRLGKHIGRVRTMLIGLVLEIPAGILLFTLPFVGWEGPWAVVLPQALYALGAGFVFPQAMAGALADHPARAGAASSLQSLISLTAAGIVTLLSLLLITAAMEGHVPLAPQSAAGLMAIIVAGLAFVPWLQIPDRQVARSA